MVPASIGAARGGYRHDRRLYAVRAGPVVGDVSPAHVLQAAEGGYKAYGYGLMAPARVATLTRATA
jgi:hypothetical protein